MKSIRIIFACVLIMGFATAVSAQKTETTKEGDIKTTEPSDKYGAGGTHVTISDKKYRLKKEYYYDKRGRKREAVYPGVPEDNFQAYNTYYDEEGKAVVIVRHTEKGDVYYDGKWNRMDPKDGKALVTKMEQTPASPGPEKPGGQVKAKPGLPPSSVSPTETWPLLGPAFSPSTFNWTGPYVGIQFGYTRTSSDYSLKLGGLWNDFPDVRNEIEFRGRHEFDENGFGLGGCAGYNYQFNNNVVIGVGVAGRKFWGLDAMHETGDFPADNAGDFDVRSRFNTTGIVTFGPKVGYACGRFLPYVSGGLAFGEIDSSQSILSSSFGIHESGKDSDLRLGWNVAAGLQYGLTNNWSLRFEYSYSDLGTFKYPGQPFPDTFHGFSSWNMATLTEHGANFGIVYNFSQFGKK